MSISNHNRRLSQGGITQHAPPLPRVNITPQASKSSESRFHSDGSSGLGFLSAPQGQPPLFGSTLPRDPGSSPQDFFESFINQWNTWVPNPTFQKRKPLLEHHLTTLLNANVLETDGSPSPELAPLEALIPLAQTLATAPISDDALQRVMSTAHGPSSLGSTLTTWLAQAAAQTPTTPWFQWTQRHWIAQKNQRLGPEGLLLEALLRRIQHPFHGLSQDCIEALAHWTQNIRIHPPSQFNRDTLSIPLMVALDFWKHQDFPSFQRHVMPLLSPKALPSFNHATPDTAPESWDRLQYGEWLQDRSTQPFTRPKNNSEGKKIEALLQPLSQPIQTSHNQSLRVDPIGILELQTLLRNLKLSPESLTLVLSRIYRQIHVPDYIQFNPTQQHWNSTGALFSFILQTPMIDSSTHKTQPSMEQWIQFPDDSPKTKRWKGYSLLLNTFLHRRLPTPPGSHLREKSRLSEELTPYWLDVCNQEKPAHPKEMIFYLATLPFPENFNTDSTLPSVEETAPKVIHSRNGFFHLAFGQLDYWEEFIQNTPPDHVLAILPSLALRIQVHCPPVPRETLATFLSLALAYLADHPPSPREDLTLRGQRMDVNKKLLVILHTLCQESTALYALSENKFIIPFMVSMAREYLFLGMGFDPEEEKQLLEILPSKAFTPFRAPLVKHLKHRASTLRKEDFYPYFIVLQALSSKNGESPRNPLPNPIMDELVATITHGSPEQIQALLSKITTLHPSQRLPLLTRLLENLPGPFKTNFLEGTFSALPTSPYFTSIPLLEKAFGGQLTDKNQSPPPLTTGSEVFLYTLALLRDGVISGTSEALRDLQKPLHDLGISISIPQSPSPLWWGQLAQCVFYALIFHQGTQSPPTSNPDYLRHLDMLGSKLTDSENPLVAQGLIHHLEKLGVPAPFITAIRNPSTPNRDNTAFIQTTLKLRHLAPLDFMDAIPILLSHPHGLDVFSQFVRDIEFRRGNTRERPRPDPNEAEMLLMLRHPTAAQSNPEAFRMMSSAISALYQYTAHGVNSVPREALVNWADVGLLTHSFSFWLYDTQGKGNSLFAQFGFEPIGPRPSDVAFDNGFYISSALRPSLPIRPETQIEFRRGYLAVSHPEDGTLIIRNSSKRFGRDRLPHPALFAPTGYDLKTLDLTQPEILQEFRSVPHYEVSGPRGKNQQIRHLLDELLSVKNQYRLWKLDLTAYGDPPAEGGPRPFLGLYGEGFKAVLSLYESIQLQRWLMGQKIHAAQSVDVLQQIKLPPYPDLAFVHGNYPIYSPMAFPVFAWQNDQWSQTGTQTRLKVTEDVLDELNALAQNQWTPDAFPNPTVVKFLQTGLKQGKNQGELVMLRPEPPETPSFTVPLATP